MIRSSRHVARLLWVTACLALPACEMRTDDAPAAPDVTVATVTPDVVPPATAPSPASTQELLTDAPPAAVAEPTTVAAKTEPAPETQPAKEEEYEFKPGSPDGTGKWYMGREIAHVMGHQGAGWLERPEREQEERPSHLLAILKKRIKPTDVFADIGAGTGFYSFRLAALVPQGRVYAVDIQQEMLDLLTTTAEQKGAKNVEPVLGTVQDPKLPPDSTDYVLLVDAYHEFDHPKEMLRNIRTALKPGGKVLLVEFRGEDVNVPIKAVHKMTQAQAKRELNAAGLKHVETIGQLPWQHVMVFEKPK